ncbi:hypothetical protein ACFSSA_11255 [Luteolibacter algae]|uniref:Uncharacterized protein n=1 Tax=Luteolibacter algae TaxID=454151 RepID=A0ABW5D9Z6_9BACT
MRGKYFGCLLLWCGLAGSVLAQEVYQIDWKEGDTPGAEWSTTGKVMNSPNGSRTFLGGITDETSTSLSLENLPEHKVLTLEVELFLVGSWDSSNKRWGPDKLNISLEDQFVLLNTTFSNCLSNDWTGSQHYPEDLTGTGNYNCFTGISYIGELGYRQTWARYQPVQNVPIDSTYKLKFSVPHTAETFTLTFQSDANEQDGDPDDQTHQWYGIGKVTVSTHNEETVDEKKWADLRGKLFNPFIPISNHAFWEMMRYPSRFRSDFELLKTFSPERKWWYSRAEQLLRIQE